MGEICEFRMHIEDTKQIQNKSLLSLDRRAYVLVEKSSLCIQSNQVAEVRTMITQRMLESPEKFGVEPIIDRQTQEQTTRRLMRDRIRPIDKRLDFGKVDTAARALRDQRA